MDSTLIVIALIALALGALIGWLLGSRGAAAGQGVADSLRLQLDGVREERDGHAHSIDTLRGEHNELATRHAAVVASQEERDRSHQRQLEALETKFAEVGGKLLDSAQKQFLERADARFKE
ncbi:MAG: DNA recombination protein RmuC, partial [Sphingomicrobium sp.]